MARSRVVHRCSSCAAVSVRWAGRCPACGDWNTLVARTESADAGEAGTGRRGAGGGGAGGGWRAAGPLPLAEVDAAGSQPRPTGLVEFDRVLAGGLVAGSVVLLGGEPGVGKSTLSLQVLRSVAAHGRRALLVSAEESPHQVRLRAQRLGPLPASLLVLAGTDLDAALEAVAATDAQLVVVDSVQTIADRSVGAPAGSLTQVRACAEAFVEVAKRRRVPVVLVGHVTKDGALAGPRTLEHLVDTVLTVEGDRHYALRLLRAVKHRFGPTGELGLFEMGEAGLTAVADPYRLLLGDRRPGAAGSVVLPAVEGQRALLVELQALVAPAVFPAQPRRSAQGVEGGRLAQLLAVLQRRTSAVPGGLDVFASVVGGLRVAEPAADLALALALASAVTGVPVPPDVVAFGEVGLGGEVRQVPHAPRRLAEAARVGFRRAVVPGAVPEGFPDLHLVRVRTVDEALHLTLDVPRRAA